MLNPDASDAADAFLQEAEHFRLGRLPTETPHPLTDDLADLARGDVAGGVARLKQVDVDALQRLLDGAEGLEDFRRAVFAALQDGSRVFLCGCGATGRLSVSLEVLWREQMPAARRPDVVSFMAGGDLALVRSIENFEDHPRYGARQLEELGFAETDLLIACTEGGETPWVIGATEHAAELSRRAPWFLYCNPDHVLRETVERSRRVLDDERIRKASAFVGPMALTGSTRMQASTVLMLTVGEALFHTDRAIRAGLEEFLGVLERADLSFLPAFVEAETAIYQAGGTVLYETDRYGVTIVTDTTERSPTFSLRGFENYHDVNPSPSPCYVHLEETMNAQEAWTKLLHRPPRALDWQGIAAIAGHQRLLGFDFSTAGRAMRLHLVSGRPSARFGVHRQAAGMVLTLGELRAVVPTEGLSLLHEHLLLKVILNIHSTLLMGRLGRYERNLMTWVRPSNKKLIDRSIRYVQHLLEAAGIHRYSYDDVARACFAEMANLSEDEAIVLKVFHALKDRDDA
ncbi:MAG: hypothetical protein FJX76_03545 [Armatimonadetes bacterium]|nr:hypothetical protein [Armatimonadota bacterium]